MGQAEQPERRSEWQFVITDDEQWIWVANPPGGAERRAGTTFPTLKACADDAKKNGWATWQSDERRQVEVRRDPVP